MTETASAANVSALTERVAWKILCALHTHVPEDERPQSWSDLAEGQEARIVDAASRAIQEVAQTYTNMQSELTAAAYQQGRGDAREDIARMFDQRAADCEKEGMFEYEQMNQERAAAIRSAP